MATLLGEPLAASLEDAWRVLLRNQFHDILPGSSIREVYEVAEAELAAVVAAGDAIAADASRPSPRASSRPATGRASSWSTPTSRPARSASRRADPLPGGQAVEGGSVLAGTRPVPGLTAAVVLDDPPPAGLSPPTAAGWRTTLLRVEIDADGTLASVFDKRAGREVLAGRGNQIWAYVDKPRNWDAWDIEESYARQGEEITAAADRGGRARPAPRGDPRRPPLPRQRRSSRPTGSGPTPPGSTSPPTSTGTSAASCSRRASRWPSAPTTPPSSARTA